MRQKIYRYFSLMIYILLICTITTNPVFAQQYASKSKYSDALPVGGHVSQQSVSVVSSLLQPIATGYEHSCALIAGGIKCWGRNYYGQLGNGTYSNSSIPVDVIGLSASATAIVAGWTHTCALMADESVMCWGNNANYQLGNGTNIKSNKPVNVVGVTSGISAIATGLVHTCVLTKTGGVKCWGVNSSGELGDGSTVERHIPVDVSGLFSGVVAIFAGGYHTCALMVGGKFKCWGYNHDGQLGDGTTIDRASPVDVSVLSSSVAAFSTGLDYSCALTTEGGVKCWGGNVAGELGNGTANGSAFPVDVVGLTSGVKYINSLYYHTCALTQNGGIKCWGSNYWGELGNGNSNNFSNIPVDVISLSSGMGFVAAGATQTCALSLIGKVECWGANFYGQVGDGTIISRSIPVDVLGLGGYSGFANDITNFVNTNAQSISQLSSYTFDVSTVGDYFLDKIPQHEVQAGVDFLLKAIDVADVDWSKVGEGLNWITTPGYQAALHASWNGWVEDAAAKHFFKPIYDMIHNDRDIVFNQVRSAGIKYYAQEAGQSWADGPFKDWLVSILYPGVGNPVWDHFGQPSQILTNAYINNLKQEQDKLISNLLVLNLSQDQIKTYQQDMLARQLANQQIVQQFGEQRDFLYNNYQKSVEDEKSWLKYLIPTFFKWVVIGGATLTWDGPGFYVSNAIVKGADLFYSLLNTARTLSQDNKMLDQSLRFLTYKTSLTYQQLSLNTVNGLNLIRAKDPPQIVKGHISGPVIENSYGHYRLWPNLWWAEDSSQVILPLQNDASFPTTFLTSAVYNHTDFWSGAARLIVEGQQPDIGGLQPGQSVISLNMGDKGISPDNNSTLNLLILGASITGMYPVANTQVTWNPTRIVSGSVQQAPEVAGYSQAQTDDAPVYSLPIKSTISSGFGTTQKVLAIEVFNPFSLTVQATLSQLIPPELNIIDSGGGQLAGSTLTWNNTLQPNTSWELKLILDWNSTNNIEVTLPGAILAFSDPNTGQGDTYTASDQKVQETWPLETSFYYPTIWKLNQPAIISANIHNISNENVAGTILMKAIGPGGTVLWSQEVALDVSASATQSLTLPINLPFRPAILAIEGTVAIASLKQKVIQDLVTVEQSKIYLPTVRR